MCDTEDDCCAPPKDSPAPTLIDTLESFIEGGSCLPPVSSISAKTVAEECSKSGLPKSDASISSVPPVQVSSDSFTKNEIQENANSGQKESKKLLESEKKEASQLSPENAGPQSGGCGGCCSGPVVEEETDLSEEGDGHGHGHAHEFYDDSDEEDYGHGHSHGHGHIHDHGHGHGHGHGDGHYYDSEESDDGHGHSHGGAGGCCGPPPEDDGHGHSHGGGCCGGGGTPDENAWIEIAIQQAELHMHIFASGILPEQIKFSNLDDPIYESFRKEFPDFDVTKITEAAMTGTEVEQKWQNWINQYKDTLEDFTTVHLLRIDPKLEYSAENTIFCIRAQFLAIEISRNKEGHNQQFAEETKKAAEAQAAAAAAAGSSGGCCSGCSH